MKGVMVQGSARWNSRPLSYWFLTSLLLFTLLLAICGDSASPLAAESGSSHSEGVEPPGQQNGDDQQQNGDNLFRFLFRGEKARVPFDPGLLSRLRVVICELGEQGCRPNIIRIFENKGRKRRPIRILGSSYAVLWRTREDQLDPAKTYRICVFVDQTELGCADVDVIATGEFRRGKKQATSGEVGPVTNGEIPLIGLTLNRSLLIRFFIGLQYVQVTAGSFHTCAVTLFRQLHCWGDNSQGQLGDGTTTDRLRPVLVIPSTSSTGPPSVMMVSAGDAHTCALTPEGQAWCWGGNSRGQLGDGTNMDRLRPVRVAGERQFTSISAGFKHTCALDTEARGLCWGRNFEGQLGNGFSGPFTDSNVPRLVAGIERFTSISAGSLHTCAVTTTFRILCWGLNDDGQLGDGSNTDRPEPRLVLLPLFNFFELQVSAGGSHTCALTTRLRQAVPPVVQEPRCWGLNDAGQLGDGTNVSTNRPVMVAAAFRLGSISAGNLHTCALSEVDGSAHCWGDNSTNQLGDGTADDSNIPVEVATVASFSMLSAGGFHTCGVPPALAGGLLCWGNNDFGQLGNGTRSPTSVPVRVISPRAPRP